MISEPIGVLALLQLARAFVLSGEKIRAKGAYQDLLRGWTEADRDIPSLKQATGTLKENDLMDTHITDHDLERYHLGMITEEGELAPL